MVDLLSMFRRRPAKRGRPGFARLGEDITALGDSFGNLLTSPVRDAPPILRDQPIPASEQPRAEPPRPRPQAVRSIASPGGAQLLRRESLEAYVKRLERIEEIAAGKSGVEKVFAMQAGREIRVMVRPDDVDDIGAAVLARDVAKQIEEELTYPGQIRVTVVRESRVTEIAR